MSQVLLVYSSVDGHTREICERLSGALETQGHRATIEELTPSSAPDPADYDAIVVGASIRYGKHRPEVAEFIESKREVLESKPSAFFSVNAVARKPAKQTAETNPYVRKYMESITWKPELVGVFAGKIDYPRYGFVDKHMIRFIMWMTKGPTDLQGTFEFTDWSAVDDFASDFGKMVGR